MDDDYPVGRVAELANVSVRTLHHYDEIGLLSPSHRTSAGHRRYTATDLQRLRDILFYRELEFPLDEIASMLADPDGSVDDRLRHQHRLLRERRDRDARLLAALERQMEARNMGISLTPEEQFEIFGTDRFGGEYADEAQQRWGDTPQWAQSQTRTAAYTKQDWVEIKAETDAVEAGFAAAFAEGEPAAGPATRDLVARHRAGIERFYDVSDHMHRCLAELYVTDTRFTAHYDDRAPGLARYVHDAILAHTPDA
ncbi:MerR family transcriptional regulator [Jatrophihabitans fulvus]